MNKKGWIILIVILIAVIGIGIYFYFSNRNNNNNNSYEASKTSTGEKSKNQEQSTNSSSEEQKKNDSSQNKNENTTEPSKQTKYTENPLSEFSTKIYSKDSARQNNIKITCNTLNGKVVKKREIFSFCNTVGQATSAKGYQKADIYDRDGNKKKGLGGGNCQISSTLYNAVLAVPSLIVTERHEHSNNVPYVAKGKDAAVAYGSYDFKFRNNLENDIKIYSSTDGSSVLVKLVSISYE